MAAGLGFKTFNTGDVLSAADTNGYLMQGVLVFADAAARSAAITSPQEGQTSYLKDTDVIQVYSGSAWVTKSGGSSPLTTKGDLYTYSTTDARLPVGTNGHTLVADSAQATGLKWAAPAGGGKVLQVVNATYSTSTATTSTSYVDTNLTASIAPTLNTSKILVLVNQVIYVGNDNTTNDVWAGYKLVRASTDIWESLGSAITVYSPSGTGLQIGYLMSIAYYDSPATTSSTAYKTQFRVRASSLTATAQHNSAISSITLLEIGA